MSPNHIDRMARANRQATAHFQAERAGEEASRPVVGRWRGECRTSSPESRPKEGPTSTTQDEKVRRSRLETDGQTREAS